MDRRQFMKTGALGVSIPAGLAAAVEHQEEKAAGAGLPERPNVLVIMTDQQFAGAMSNAGNVDLHTPAMDFIARNGVSFDRTYCSNPICVPSRTSWLTGHYPHQTNVTYNMGGKMEIARKPLSRLFKENGYDTGYAGKWHIPHDHNDSDWHGFDYLSNIRSNDVDFDIPGPTCEFLGKKRDKPFLFVASFVNPHDICQWARMASGMDDHLRNGDIPELPELDQCPPLPANLNVPENEPSVIRDQQAKAKSTYPTVDWPDEKWREYRWAYYRMTELVDAHIKTILDKLKETGQLENTLIIFTSDHGDGIGAHRWNQKTLFYDEISRIPLIFSHPGLAKAGSRDTRNLSNMNLDMFPTALDFCGIPIPENVPGISLKPLIEGQDGASGHDQVFSQNDLQVTFGESGGIFGRMVRSNRYKYTCYSEGQNPEQLFDMELDPGETTSLAHSSEHQRILLEHRQLLQKFINDTGDSFTLPT